MPSDGPITSNGYMLNVGGVFLPETYSVNANTCVTSVFRSVDTFNRMGEVLKVTLVPVTMNVSRRIEKE